MVLRCRCAILGCPGCEGAPGCLPRARPARQSGQHLRCCEARSGPRQTDSPAEALMAPVSVLTARCSDKVSEQELRKWRAVLYGMLCNSKLVMLRCYCICAQAALQGC